MATETQLCGQVQCQGVPTGGREIEVHIAGVSRHLSAIDLIAVAFDRIVFVPSGDLRFGPNIESRPIG
ncbi:hypothetical protein D3C81_1362270 [compost metagenome]